MRERCHDPRDAEEVRGNAGSSRMRGPPPSDWSGIVSWWSWIVVAVGLMAAAIDVQFDEPWLEVLGTAAFLILFAWMVVVLRRGTGAAKSELLRPELSPRTHASNTRVPTSSPRDS